MLTRSRTWLTTKLHDSWLGRHTSLALRSAIVLLLVIVVAESVLLSVQQSVNRKIEAQSAKLLNTFLQQDTVQAARTPGVPIRLQNVRFKWSDRVYVDTADMTVRAVPIQGTVVDFDDLDSFLLLVQKSDVVIRPDVLEGMLNESVFNYPESKLRDLTVTLTDYKGQRALRLAGKIKVMFWIPFKMNALLSVDTKTNTLVMEAHHVKAMGFLPASKIIKMEPFQLEHLLSLPPNRSLTVATNRIMVKPFGLFPPPRINGRIASVTIEDKVIRLGFAGDAIPAPEAAAKNYVYIKGGISQFGTFRMLQTDILIQDQDPDDLFVFSLLHYADLIPKSRIELPDTRSARLTMPDFQEPNDNRGGTTQILPPKAREAGAKG
jgi:hypothetical protein